MTIWNLGSINLDLIYGMDRLPGRGETVAATSKAEFLGGKGTNMSVAAARAAARVCHIGAVGPDGRWAKDRLLEYGVDTRHIAQIDSPTGHAIVAVEVAGENQIIIFSGANRAIPPELVSNALAEAQTGDILILQNETNAQVETAQMGKELGLRVCYAAAPFDADAVKAVLPFLDFLILNAVEAQQLQTALGTAISDLPVRDIIVTKGADGAEWICTETGSNQAFPARKVQAVDTTGAGDTFTGYVLAGLDRGMPMAQAISQAMLAASIMVTRHGTADVIPDLKDIQDLML
ncbi:ribokinase [Aestuariivita boseongensis]|uniref:ribokinase n=1 Tax=Aestuariivita boseongensis TaxID=1470562 RepID=UPI000680862E|nr:ribokinase [Aestuariivita boseongensis]